jgi:hypothetical protein
VAVAFVTAWARPDVSAATWRAALAPLSTPALRKSMRFTDPARVPATRVVARGSTAHLSPGRDVVRVVTDGGTVAVMLLWDAGRWVVDEIGPADRPPAADPPPVGPTITAGG